MFLDLMLVACLHQMRFVIIYCGYWILTQKISIFIDIAIKFSVTLYTFA